MAVPRAPFHEWPTIQTTAARDLNTAVLRNRPILDRTGCGLAALLGMGISLGETDDHCYNVVRDPVHVPVIQHCGNRRRAWKRTAQLYVARPWNRPVYVRPEHVPRGT
jgi:hypothetical protein